MKGTMEMDSLKHPGGSLGVVDSFCYCDAISREGGCFESIVAK